MCYRALYHLLMHFVAKKNNIRDRMMMTMNFFYNLLGRDKKCRSWWVTHEHSQKTNTPHTSKLHDDMMIIIRITTTKGKSKKHITSGRVEDDEITTAPILSLSFIQFIHRSYHLFKKSQSIIFETLSYSFPIISSSPS